MKLAGAVGLGLLASVVLWIAPAAVSAQCKPGDILVGEDADNYYCRSRAEYLGTPAESASVRFCNARRALGADQDAIRFLGFATDVERFETFEGVARQQKAELQRKVFDALLDQGFEATGRAVDAAKSLNPWNVNTAVRLLEEKGFRNRTVVTALRRIAATKDKPAMAAAYHQFADVAKAAKEGWSTGAEMGTDPTNAERRLLLGALKVMQGNPELGLVVTGAEMGESLAYLVYLSGGVGDLTRSTDDKLLRLATLSDRLKSHVKDVRTSRQQWRDAMRIRTGEPHCGS